MFKFTLIFIFSFAFFVFCESYIDYKLINLRLTDPSQIKALDTSLDIWSHNSNVIVGENQVLCSPQQYKDLLSIFKNEISQGSVTVEVLDENIQRAIDEEREASDNAKKESALKAHQNDEDFFKAFQRYPDIVTFVRKLHADFPQNTELFILSNRTIENREIIGIRVFSDGGYNPGKKGLFMNAMQHAREWISTPTLLYLTWSLLHKYKRGDPSIVPLMNVVNLHVVPVVNPDGYEFSFNSRMWRKNRRPNNDAGRSFGVDLNRNFVVAWGGPGSSRQPNSDTYCGTRALSEAESTGIDKYLKANPAIKVGIDYHSFATTLLRNWDYTINPSPEEAVLLGMSNRWKLAMDTVGRIRWLIQRGAQMYVHSGGLMDHFLAGLDGGRKILGFTVELRGSNFVVNPSLIIPSGQENEAGVITVLEHIRDMTN